MHKKLLFLSLIGLTFASKAYNDHGAAMRSHELVQLNQTLINNQPAIDGNINRSINNIQRILAYHDVYDYQQELDQHFINLEAAIEGGLAGDTNLKTQCKANLLFLRRIIQFSIKRSSDAEFKDRASKVLLSGLGFCSGSILAAIAYLMGSLINEPKSKQLIGTDLDYGPFSARTTSSFDNDAFAGKLIMGTYSALLAGCSIPVFYLAAKSLKRCCFFNDHLKNREKCIQEYAQREQELEKNLEHVLG